MEFQIIAIIASCIGLFTLLYLIISILKLRIVVNTNVVHIVQRNKTTVSYGVGNPSNVYYKFPKWVPFLGVSVQILPVYNFNIDLSDYNAYDKDRVPFVVDIKSFFRIKDTNKAAAKVSSFEDLKVQLKGVVEGSIRSILAKSTLMEIMQERAVFGDHFTEILKDDLENWGVEVVKNVELMDIRDTSNENIIKNIMDRKTSAIKMESRVEVANNNKTAEEAELDAKRAVEVKRAQTAREAGEANAKSEQAIGIAKAEAIKKVGIAEQESLSEIEKAKKSLTEERMSVMKIEQIRTAEIEKENAIIKAEEEKAKMEIDTQAEKFKIETIAIANLEASNKEAEAKRLIGEAEAKVIEAKGRADAESRKEMELASVTAQVTLSKEIGENQSYQDYLIKIREVEVSGEVEKIRHKSLAEALNGADLKLLVNSGDVSTGLNSFSNILSTKGGSAINGLVEGLKQTPEGMGLVSLLNKFTGGQSSDKA